MEAKQIGSAAVMGAAAGMMSAAAAANGGGVAAGSLVATLQSVGAAGLGAGATVGVATGGAALGIVVVGGTVAVALALEKRLQRCRKARASAKQSNGPVSGQWTVATQEGNGTLKFYPFNKQDAAVAFVGEITVAFVLYGPDGREIKSWGLNPWALSTIRERSSQSPVGEWKVVTEEGIGNVKFYLFDSEHNARCFFKGLLCCRILVDPAGKEISHAGQNPWAINTIRAYALQNPAGTWKVATEEGVGNVKEYHFDIPENARVFFRGLLCSCILVDPAGKEIGHRGLNLFAVSTIRTRTLQNPTGTWKVATEEGVGNVKVYCFNISENAHLFFKGLLCSRILIDPQGKEICHGGQNPWAINTIRTRTLQSEGGAWKVISEEGIGNVKVYVFSHEHNARTFFNELFVARILFDKKGKEIGCKGWNPWALRTIRTHASRMQLAK